MVHAPDSAPSEIGFELAPVGLAVTRQRIIVQCNQRFCETFGYPREALEGQSLSRLYPSEQEFEQIGARGEKLMQGSGRYNDERIMRRSDGALFWCRVRGQSLTPADPFAHAVWSFADLSQLRPVVDITQREREVAMHLVAGLTSKETARQLGLSPRTVEAHRARLMTKFGAANGSQLIARLSGAPI